MDFTWFFYVKKIDSQNYFLFFNDFAVISFVQAVHGSADISINDDAFQLNDHGPTFFFSFVRRSHELLLCFFRLKRVCLLS